jgi:hypothetical protein
VLDALPLLAFVAVILLEWKFALRMGREVSLYASGALENRSERARTAGQAAGYILGFALWLPLLLFNVAVFRTAWPVTGRRLVPRRF